MWFTGGELLSSDELFLMMFSIQTANILQISTAPLKKLSFTREILGFR